MPEQITISTIDPKEYEGKVMIARCKRHISNDEKHRLSESLQDIFGDIAKRIVVLSDEIEFEFAEDKGELEIGEGNV